MVRVFWCAIADAGQLYSVAVLRSGVDRERVSMGSSMRLRESVQVSKGVVSRLGGGCHVEAAM